MNIKDLTPDPKNARRHSPRNVEMIVEALREVGAARSIVIDEDGTILAGNATVEAAIKAGIIKLRTVEVDGSEIVAVQRSGLDEDQKTKLSLYDNRTAELADGWDTSVLDELQEEGVDLLGLWEDEELEALMDEAADGFDPVDGLSGESVLGDYEYRVVVDVPDETAQEELISKLEEEGYECRPLIS